MPDNTPTETTVNGGLTTAPETQTAQLCTSNCNGDCKCEPVPPAFRSVTIQVPPSVTDEHVEMAIQMGSMSVNTILSGGVQMFFPTMVAGPDGQKCRSIGQVQVPISSPRDIQRLVGLANVIGQLNTEQAKAAASGRVGAHVEAAITSENTKDNATRELTAQAEGRAGGIIIPG